MITLLIVDDQTSVVNGIRTGVQWVETGVDRVLEAYHAAGAKRIFSKHKVDILLCDIEMPAEDGISLLRWVRAQGYQTACIFLTAHAEFSYARQALQLGSVDYIVQPARYDDIQSTVKKTVEDILESQREAEYYDFGKLLSRKKMTILDGLFAKILNGFSKDIKGLLENCLELDIPLKENSDIYLSKIVLFGKQVALEEGLQQYALMNILKELFVEYGQDMILSGLEKNTYMLLVFQAENQLIDSMGMQRLLSEFMSRCLSYYSMKMACYVCEKAAFSQLGACIEVISLMARNNVTEEKGIFLHLNKSREEKPELLYFQKQKFINYIVQGYFSTAGQELIECLEKLKKARMMDAETLNVFYQDFQEILYLSGEKTKVSAADLCRKPEIAGYMEQANVSLGHMEQYINAVLDCYENQLQKKEEDKTQVDKVIEYIGRNIEKDLKRPDIAEALHLNPDYLSRIFKQKTGKSLKTYIREEKMQLARILLNTTHLPVGDIALRVGYTNFSHFSQSYKRVIGKQPLEERKSK